MKIIAINGSPSKSGHTVALLKEVLSVVKQNKGETELLHALDLVKSCKQPFCINCSSPCNCSCFEGTSCEQAFAKMATADAIVLGSPVYFGTVSGILKAFWDKTRDLRGEKVLVGKIGAAVSSGHARFGGQESTMRALQEMMLVQGMTVIGDGAFDEDAGHFGAAASGDVDDEDLKRAKILGKRVVDSLQKIFD